MNWQPHISWCPFHAPKKDSGFLDWVKERVEFIRSSHAKIYEEGDITLALITTVSDELEQRGSEYEFGEGTFRDLVASIGAILVRWALKIYRKNPPEIIKRNHKKHLLNHLKWYLDQESQDFFSRLFEGAKIHTMLDDISRKATNLENSIFSQRPNLRGVDFVSFIKESQLSTGLNTIDKVLYPLRSRWLDRQKLTALIHDSGLHLLRDIAWGWNHLEKRIIAGVGVFGRPPALTKIWSDKNSLQFQVTPEQIFPEWTQISHFSCGALFQHGNDGYKNLFEEFVLTLAESYIDTFAS